MRRIAAPLIAGILLLPAALRADDAEGIAFFEKKIRPVLVEHCYPCHSADAAAKAKLRGGLRLDHRDGLRTGGDSGPAIVAGKPDESLLLKTLRHEGDIRMPPRGKLPDAVIADVAAWLRMGAPDPRTGTAPLRSTALSIEAGRQFWAYQPLVDPPVPEMRGKNWPVNEIDRFILTALEAKGLVPSPDADRAVLARRVSFDLTGLPLPPAEVDAFVADRSPDAYEKLVDRLLASPAFGEHWGRHWLDVARYGESLTLRGFILKEAWRYRDYVIDSFNRDVPFDRLIREQIAGDLLTAGSVEERRRQIIATGFLALGNTNLEEQDKKQLRMDVVDEQLDVITRGFLAQTVTCARCHDHKFDPIPTRDYYALAGILRNAKAMEHANVSKWIEVPLPVGPAEEIALKEHESRIAKLQARITAAKGTGTAGALAVKDVPGIVVDDVEAKKVGTWQDSTYNRTFIGTGYTHDQNADKGKKTITFQPELPADGLYEVWFAYSPGTNRAAAVPVTVFSADGEKTITVNMKATPPIEGRYRSLGEYRFEKSGQSFVIVSNEGTTGHVTPDAVVFLPPDRPVAVKSNRRSADSLRALEAELKRLRQTGPVRPMALSVVEEKVIEDARVHVRGSVHNLGEPAPRGFLRVATRGAVPEIPASESGRKELAEWIASPDNPLTARVIVNRAWHWLLGSGIVRTVDNFGTTGEPPSHPELLDHLAAQFVADGWSMKKLVRRIVLSRTYRQASTAAVAADPENRLFGRASRRRLEAECIRDAMLAVSGQLSTERGGRTFPANLPSDYGYRGTSKRRSVYLPAFRNAMPDLLAAFDPADPSLVTGRRDTSTVAPQALVMLNHPFVIEQARHAAKRLLAAELPDDPTRVDRAYRLTLGREPTTGETKVAVRFLKEKKPEEAWTALFHALFASADYRYVD